MREYCLITYDEVRMMEDLECLGFERLDRNTLYVPNSELLLMVFPYGERVGDLRDSLELIAV
jgi:hypothetical protein